MKRIHIEGQSFKKSSVESFCEAITLRVICCCYFSFYSEKEKNIVDEIASKIASSVSEKHFWSSITTNDLFDKHFCNGSCFLVWKRKSFRPFGEVILHDQ